MGIINVTPDSFSDGGLFEDYEAAVAQGVRLVADGADVLDIGGESTRPNAPAISADEELERTIPVVEALARMVDTPISIDTSKASVARAALAAGAEIVNDVTGLEGDDDMVAAVVEGEAAVCAMHMQGSPRTMQHDPTYDDVVADIESYLAARIDALVAAGVDQRRIAADPGIGFGKTVEHNLTLLRSAAVFHDLGVPVVVGHSRKSFMGKVLGDVHGDRTAATVGASLALARRSVQVLRVHDVAETVAALALFDAAGGLDLER